MASLVINSGVINAVGCRIPLQSNWNHRLLQQLCTSDSDREVATYLLYGWLLNRDPGPVAQTYCNHRSAQRYPQQVCDYLLKELKLGAMMGPYVTSPFPQEITGVSPMSTTPKKRTWKRRIIVDLSWPPQGNSVNSRIPIETYMGVPVKLKYPTY